MTHCQLKAEELINTPSDALTLLKAKTQGHTLGNVDCETLVDTFADTLT